MVAPELRNILIGLIQGDGSIMKKNNTYYFRFEQGSHAHKEYLFHVFNLFKDYCFQIEPLTFNREDGRISWYFRTWGLDIFKEGGSPLYDLFRSGNSKKFIPEGLVRDYQTPEGLAYWIADDGTRDSNTVILNTQGFKKSEVEIQSRELNINIKFKLNPFYEWCLIKKIKPRSLIQLIIGL